MVPRADKRRGDASDPAAQLAGFLLSGGVVRAYRWVAGDIAADRCTWNPQSELLCVRIPARTAPLLALPLLARLPRVCSDDSLFLAAAARTDGMPVYLLADDGATYDLAFHVTLPI